MYLTYHACNQQCEILVIEIIDLNIYLNAPTPNKEPDVLVIIYGKSLNIYNKKILQWIKGNRKQINLRTLFHIPESWNWERYEEQSLQRQLFLLCSQCIWSNPSPLFTSIAHLLNVTLTEGQLLMEELY